MVRLRLWREDGCEGLLWLLRPAVRQACRGSDIGSRAGWLHRVDSRSQGRFLLVIYDRRIMVDFVYTCRKGLRVRSTVEGEGVGGVEGVGRVIDILACDRQTKIRRNRSS